ncbi:hypothetical protein TorRG33x02_316530 [Trema orientale]|uniref:Uncharacterized protein n=1 Tax=Trema orientale TaxID=63057 RepID=A0A2P5BLN0_TREOI|nr:hypothetical protein TorRG33x02_316530 [Trema orientale]
MLRGDLFSSQKENVSRNGNPQQHNCLFKRTKRTRKLKSQAINFRSIKTKYLATMHLRLLMVAIQSEHIANSGYQICHRNLHESLCR